jgi:hypothetical protein
MKLALIAFGMLLATTAAQAEIVCTQHGGCHETGMKLIYGDGSGVDGTVPRHSFRGDKKQPVKIRRMINTDH